MKRFIPYARQDINENDIQAVVEILQSDWLTQGPTIEKFEKACQTFCQVPHVVAVNSATAALHLACLALDVQQGDYVWTSPNTFVASANCALFCGGKVDFVDIDKKTYNLCPQKLEEKLLKAKKTNQLPKVVIVVHFAGQACDMKKIKYLSGVYDFRIIEDASHALGAFYEDKPVGSCQYSDLTIFSLHAVKIMTSGEGGLLATQSSGLYEKIKLLRSHGVTRDVKQMTVDSPGDWYYQQIALGFNYRLTEIQSALGLSQLKRLNEFTTKRRQIAQRYDNALKDLPIITPWQAAQVASSYHLYPIQILEKNRKEVFNRLREKGIGVNVHYIPVHTQPYYQQLGFKQGDFPISEGYYEKAISLPIHTSLKDEEQNYVIETLEDILR